MSRLNNDDYVQNGIAANFTYLDRLFGFDERSIALVEGEELVWRSMTPELQEYTELINREEEAARILEINRLRDNLDIEGFRDPYLGVEDEEEANMNKQVFLELQAKGERDKELAKRLHEDDFEFAHLYDSDANNESTRYRYNNLAGEDFLELSHPLMISIILLTEVLSKYKDRFKPDAPWSFLTIWHIYQELPNKILDYYAGLIAPRESNEMKYVATFVRSADIFKKLSEYDNKKDLNTTLWKFGIPQLEDYEFSFDGLVLPNDYLTTDSIYDETGATWEIFTPEFVTQNPKDGELYYGAVSFSSEFVKIIDEIFDYNWA